MYDRNKLSNLQKGYTLAEFIIYAGLLSALLLIMSSAFASVVATQNEAKSYSSVDEDARYIMAKMAYDFQSTNGADTVNNHIDLPATGSTSATLQVTLNSVSYTYSVASGNLQLTANAAPENLNSIDTSISNVSFQRIGNGTHDSVRMSFTVTSKARQTSGSKTKSFQTTLAFP